MDVKFRKEALILAEKHGFILKSLRTFEGHDGMGFNANLYENKKKVCAIHDGAYGGCYEYSWFNREAAKRFEEFIKKLPKLEFDGKPYDPDEDSFISVFVDHIQSEKDRKNMIKNKISFFLKDDPKHYRYYPLRSNTREEFVFLLKKIQKEYGDNIKEIINLSYPNAYGIKNIKEVL